MLQFFFYPRFKFKVIEYNFPLIYGDEFGARIMDVRLALTSLYNEYAIESTTNDFDERLLTNVGCTSSGVSNSSGTSSSVASPLVSLDKWKLGLPGFLKESKSIERKSDLELYLDDGLWPDEDE